MARYRTELLRLFRADLCNRVRGLRRVWIALPLAMALGPAVSLYLLLIAAPIELAGDVLLDGGLGQFLRVYGAAVASLADDLTRFLLLALELSSLTGVVLAWAVLSWMLMPVAYLVGRSFGALFLKNVGLDATWHEEVEAMLRARLRRPYRLLFAAWCIAVVGYAVHRTGGAVARLEELVAAGVELMATLPLMAAVIVAMYYHQVSRLDRERPALAVLAYHVSRNRVRDNFSLTIGFLGYLALLGWILLPGLLLLVQWIDSELFQRPTLMFDVGRVFDEAADGGRHGSLSVITRWTAMFPDTAAHWRAFMSHCFATVLLYYLSSTVGIAWARWRLRRDLAILRGVLVSTLKTTVFFLLIEMIIGSLFFVQASRSEAALLFLFLLNFFLNQDQERELPPAADEPG